MDLHSLIELIKAVVSFINSLAGVAVVWLLVVTILYHMKCYEGKEDNGNSSQEVARSTPRIHQELDIEQYSPIRMTRGEMLDSFDQATM